MEYDSGRHELNSWAKKQIRSEFAHFKDKKFSRKDIDADYKKLSSIESNSLLRFQIIGGKIYSNYKDIDRSDSNLVTAYNSYLRFFDHIS